MREATPGVQIQITAQRSMVTLSLSPSIVTSAWPQPVSVTDADWPSCLPPLTVPVSVPDTAQVQLADQVEVLRCAASTL